MPELVPWQGEPESVRLVVVFTGSLAQFRHGLATWLLRHRGSLDLFGAPIDGVELPWPAGSETWVLSVGTLPEYGMLGWWLQRDPEWKVFYQTADANSRVSDYAALEGCYLPWGCVWAGSKPDFAEPAVLWHGSRKLMLPETLGNVFEQFDRREALDFDARAAAAARSSGGPTPAKDRFEIGLAAAVDRAPSNPQSERDRLRKKIREMEEQAATLDWLVGDQPSDVFLWIYPERVSAEWGVGTHWDLRNWFFAASADAVAEFTHARIEVEELGPVHILKPEDLSRAARSTPPQPTWKLRLDRAWRREGSKVFVSDGLELRPAPPLRNPHVVNLLRDALWQGCEPDSDILLLVRDVRDGRNLDFRFGVSEREFRKLSTRVDELNHHVALRTLLRSVSGTAAMLKAHSSDLPGPDPMELILASIRIQLEERLKAHTARMKEVLADAWERQKADIDVERARVNEAELGVNAIQAASEEVGRLHSEISALRGKEWDVWTKALAGILQADRRLLPPERADLRKWLQELDEVRAEIAGLWRPGRHEEGGGDPGHRLRELANEMRK